MNEILQRLGVSQSDILAFCRKWNIARFEVFGSVTRDDFDDASDVDVLVTFSDEQRVRLHDLVEMESELATLFGRGVDLVKRRLIEESRNWIRRRAILDGARLLYAAA
jgi:predicted nucleotidyltransferase